MNRDDEKILLKAQQGEMDAVLMYNTLADACSDPLDRATFQQLAREEGKHASIFHQLTGRNLKPKKGKAILVSLLYRTVGKKRLYPKIARGEYDAAGTYESVAEKFPQIQSIRSDEQRHGDTVRALLN